MSFVDTNYQHQKSIASEEMLSDFAHQFSTHITPGMIIGLRGDIGSGKTTFVRSLGQALGSHDWINSPTYSIIQSYIAKDLTIVHVDLYRCTSDGDIDQLDLFSLLNDHSILIIEWVDQSSHIQSDIVCDFTYINDHERLLTISSHNCEWITQL